jgi:hypothetical protein
MAGFAGVSAVKNHLMGKRYPSVSGYYAQEVLLYALGSFRIGKIQSPGNSKDVSVDHDAFRFAKGDAQYYICSLARDSRKEQ